MHDTGCLGLVHWDDPEGWYGEGGGRRGNTCIPVVDSFQYMANQYNIVKLKKKTTAVTRVSGEEMIKLFCQPRKCQMGGWAPSHS